jgi:hypothetical protein
VRLCLLGYDREMDAYNSRKPVKLAASVDHGESCVLRGAEVERLESYCRAARVDALDARLRRAAAGNKTPCRCAMTLSRYRARCVCAPRQLILWCPPAQCAGEAKLRVSR